MASSYEDAHYTPDVALGEQQAADPAATALLVALGGGIEPELVVWDRAPRVLGELTAAEPRLFAADEDEEELTPSLVSE